MALLLARHGQTTANAAGLLVGRIDPELTDLGRRQAVALGSAAGVPGATRVVCSPLGRCRATAAALGLGVPVEIDERWIEIDYGPLDGTALKDVPSAVWRSWRADPGWRPPGGESLVDVGLRVRAALSDLVEEAAADDIVVVSHVSPLKAALAWALGTGDEVAWRIHLATACLNRIVVTPAGPSVHSVNETTHLAGLD